jgi:hypothetical protein
MPPPGRSFSASGAILAGSETKNESTALLRRHNSEGDAANEVHQANASANAFIIPNSVSSTWLPSENLDPRPCIRRRIFLLLTEPSSSISSLIFFFFLILTITLSNLIMILQTTEQWQFIPTDCVSCGGTVVYMFEDDSIGMDSMLQDCQCAPAPKTYTVVLEDLLIYFFSVEWALRVLCFEPPLAEKAHSFSGFLKQFVGYLFETTTILDFLAIFPYYMERFGSNTKGLLSLRLLRLFRVFQLVRLGQFNATFIILRNVLSNSVPYLRLLMVCLMFGSAFFGSMLYWLEKGEWQYWEETGDYQFIRFATDGVTQEISPFTDIPQGFWWFMVTATTVGYGDMYPTSVAGKGIAMLAMLSGVLVIAFPVSVFSDLWQKELKEEGGLSPPQEDHLSGPKVELSLEDVKLLRENFQAVEDHQRKIRHIFAKYDLHS